ncbi:hypothetical protein SAMN02910317_01588 [Ruminococcaceae bacterium FB2012]|nr:hypothetical protein SAMN02910317_01588 [Ruminococcaceae bacterium FB2012]
MLIKRALLIFAAAMVLSSCGKTDPSLQGNAVQNTTGSAADTDADSAASETEVSKADDLPDNYPEMLKEYVDRKKDDQTSDYDRMMFDVSILSKEDQKKFFEDFENFGDSKLSGFLKFSDVDNGGKDDGGIYMKSYLYGPYLLNLKGFKNVTINEDTVEADGQLDISVCRPINLYQSGYTYPYVQIRRFDKNGNDMKVESHTREEIEKLAEIDLNYHEDDPKPLPEPVKNE